MNLGRIFPAGALRAILHSVIWSVRITAVCIFAVALMDILGCVQTEPVQKSASPEVVEPQTSPPIEEPHQASPPPPDEPHFLEGSGITVWAKEFEGQLIEGLDGSLYEPYGRTTIERVQKALGGRGLYEGPVNGILDRPTMQSIVAFQKEDYHLQQCGVPTPHTRKMLEQGSHTDLGLPRRYDGG
jgi:hypothetical protein